MERALDSLRPAKFRRLFQRHEAPRAPSQPSQQPSKPPEHQARSRTIPDLASNVSEESVNKSPLQASRKPVEHGILNAELDNRIDPPLLNNSAPERYSVDPEARDPPYTGGPSRIIVTSDGTQDCLALLLTRDVVTSINKLLSGASKVNRLEEKIDALDTEITFAEISLKQYPSLIEALPEMPGKGDEEAKIRTKIEETKEQSQKASSSKEAFEGTLYREKLNLAYLRDEMQELFQRVLSESGLLEVGQERLEMAEIDTRSVDNAEPRCSKFSTESLETLISADELNRRVTHDELETSRELFHSLKDQFENREAFYDSEFREYQEAVEEGSCVLPQSEFDRIFVRNMSRLTRALINAETAYESAKARARALRVIGNGFEQESDFADHEDDGYRESYEADMAAGADRCFIDRWMEVTEKSEDQEDDPLIDETDHWDARTVEISDSISLVAEGRDRVRIDRWYKTGGM